MTGQHEAGDATGNSEQTDEPWTTSDGEQSGVDADEASRIDADEQSGFGGDNGVVERVAGRLGVRSVLQTPLAGRLKRTSDGADPTGNDSIVGEQHVPRRTDDWTPLDPNPDREQPLDRPIRSQLLADVREADIDDSVGFLDAPADEFVEHRWFDFGYLDVAEVLEWKWVNEPFAYVAVVEEAGDNKQRYLVGEPVLDAYEAYVRRDLMQAVRNKLLYRDLDDGDRRETAFREELRTIVESTATAVAEDGTLHKLLYYLERDYVDMGPIDPFLRDEDIEDISCDGHDIPIFVYHFDYRDLMTNVGFDGAEELQEFVLQLANRAGEQISVSNPLVDASLPDGSRLQLSFGGEISTRGANFTLRRFANVPYTPVQLIDWGTFTVEQMAYFWLAIENSRSLVFTGGTGSGKTTSMNAVSFFVPEDSKVVSIEDTREITLPHDNWIQQVTRDAIGGNDRGAVSMYDLLEASLRQRPEYLLIGEIRTDPRVAFTFFQAIGTGHTAYTTMHAESISGVINRLKNEPLNVPAQMITDLDIISIQTQTFQDGDRVRRNQNVTEVLSLDDTDDVTAGEVFRRDAESDTIRKTGESRVLRDIAAERGWSRTELYRELQTREEVLQYLLDNGIDGYQAVTSVIDEFGNHREWLLERIREEELETADVLGRPSPAVNVGDAGTGRILGGANDAGQGPGADATADDGEDAPEEPAATAVSDEGTGPTDDGDGSLGVE